MLMLSVERHGRVHWERCIVYYTYFDECTVTNLHSGNKTIDVLSFEEYSFQSPKLIHIREL